MEIVDQILEKMPGVSRGQKQFMIVVIATMYGMRGKATFVNLSRYSELNEKTYRRHYGQEFDFMGFNLELIKESKSGKGQILAIDCSFIPKRGKQTYGIDNYYNGSNSRNERGLEITEFAVVDLGQNTAYSLATRQTPPNLTAKTKDSVDDSTRVDWYGGYFSEIRERIPSDIRYLVADGYFAKEKFVNIVSKENFHIISKLREDADIQLVYQGDYSGRGRPRKYLSKMELSNSDHWVLVKDLSPTVTLYTQVAYWMTTKSLVRIAYLKDSSKVNKVSHTLLFTTDIDLAPELIVSHYHSRFQIEFLFRDAKQFTSLTLFQTRDKTKLNFHFNISLLAVNVAKSSILLDKDKSSPFVFSLDNFKRRFSNLLFLDVFISNLDLDPDLVLNHPCFPNLVNFGLMAA